MQTANVNDPASIERVYSREDFEADARQNVRDKDTVSHGVMILSMPDTDGNFALMRSKRHIGEPGETTHSIFMPPSLQSAEYAAFVPTGTGYDGGPVEATEKPGDPGDPYRSFINSLAETARNADFPPEPPAERLKGFRGG